MDSPPFIQQVSLTVFRTNPSLAANLLTDAWLFVVLIASVGFVVLAIGKFKLHPFIALVIAALFVGIMARLIPESTAVDGAPGSSALSPHREKRSLINPLCLCRSRRHLLAHRSPPGIHCSSGSIAAGCWIFHHRGHSRRNHPRSDR